MFGRLPFDFNPDGSIVTNPAYQEILRLRDMLTAVNIPFEIEARLDGWKISYPHLCPIESQVCSAIQNFCSYGHEDDRLEIMGLLTAEEGDEGDVCGWLTAEDVYLRIVSHHMNTQEASRVEKENQ